MERRKSDWRKSDQKIFVADISKANQKFEWKPEIDKNQGIKKMIKWIYSINKLS